MNITDLMDRKRIELRDIRHTMDGLNPNTSSFKLYAMREKQVLADLEQLGAQRTARAKSVAQ